MKTLLLASALIVGTALSARADTTADQLAQAQLVSAQAQAAASQQAALKGAVPGTGYSGAVKLDSAAGTLEATLIDAELVRKIAAQIRTRIGLAGEGAPLVVLRRAAYPDLSAGPLFDAQVAFLGERLSQDIQAVQIQLDAAAEPAAPPAPSQSKLHPKRRSVTHRAAPVLGASPIGAVLQLAPALISYASTDYEVQGLSVSPDDLLLSAALQEAGGAMDGDLADPTDANGDIFAKLDELNDRIQTANQRILEANRVMAKAPKAKDGQPDPLADLKQATGALAADIATADAFIATLTKSGSGALSLVAQSKTLASAIDQGGLLLIKTHAAGGSVVTEHNLIAGLFGVPMKVSGGVVASFVYYPPGHSAKGRKAGMVVVKSGQIKLDAITPAALEALGQPN